MLRNTNREYMFAFANIVSAFGSTISYLLVILFVANNFEVNQSSTIISIYSLSNIISMLVSGYIFDNYNKIKALYLVQLFASILMIALAMLIEQSGKQYIIAIIVLLSITSGIDSNLASSVLPEFTKDLLNIKNVNTFLQIGLRATSVFSGLIVAAMVKAGMYATGFWIDSFSYFMAFIVYLRLSNTQESIAPKQFDHSNYKESLKYLLHHRDISLTILIIVLITFSLGPIDSLLPHILNKQGWGTESFGYINSAFSFGGFCVALLLFVRKNKILSQMDISLLLCVFSASFILFSLFINFFLVLTCIALMGFASVKLLIDCKSAAQIATPSNIIGKVMALLSLLLKIAKPVSFFVAGIITKYFTPESFFVIMALLFVSISIPYAIAIQNHKKGGQ